MKVKTILFSLRAAARLINVRHKGSESTTPSLLGPLHLSGWLHANMGVEFGRELSDTLLRVFLSGWIYNYEGNAAVCFAVGF